MKPELIFLSVILALLALLVVFFNLRSKRPKSNKKSGKEPCQAIQEAVKKLSDLPSPVTQTISPIISSTPTPKMNRADALKAANRNRQAEGRLRAQKARDALGTGQNPEEVAVECGYKTVKYMREKVRELEREGLPA